MTTLHCFLSPMSVAEINMSFLSFVAVMALPFSAVAAPHMMFTGHAETDEAIHNLIVRNSEEAWGYDFADLHINDKRPITKRDLEMHSKGGSDDDVTKVELRLHKGGTLRMSLRRRSVLTEDTVVRTLNEGGEEEIWRPGKRNCYYTGEFVGTDGHAAVSMCDGTLMASLTSSDRSYEVLSLPEAPPSHRRSPSLSPGPMRVMVTWVGSHDRREVDEPIPTTTTPTPAPSTTEADSEECQLDENGECEDEMEIPPGEGDEISQLPTNRTITVEIKNVLDKWYIAAVVNKYGYNTTAYLVSLQVLKWSGVQHVLGDAERITWNITIKLTSIDIWRVHPTFYNISVNSKLGQRAKQICRSDEMKADLSFDQLTLSTSNTTNPGLIGVAWGSGVCTSAYRCAAVRTFNLKYKTEVHELGHTMGLDHDSKAGMACPSDGRQGFMGTDYTYFRTDCYIAKYNRLLPRKECLFVESSNTSVPLRPQIWQ